MPQLVALSNVDHDGQRFGKGQVFEANENEAQALVSAGAAVLVGNEQLVEPEAPAEADGTPVEQPAEAQPVEETAPAEEAPATEEATSAPSSEEAPADAEQSVKVRIK